MAFIKPIHHNFLSRVRRTLITHLGYNFVFSRSFGELTSLVYVVCEWFLHIYVFSQLHSCHGCHCMLMIRCRDSHGINITFHFFEHYSEIFIAFSIREFIKTCFTTSHVNITKGNYVIYTVIVGVCNIRRTFASSTDSRNIEFVARSDESFTKNVAWDNKKTARRNGRTFNKISSAC